jgi:alkyldihydroxyacetonephosphate synthase
MGIDRKELRWNGWGWRDFENPLEGREEAWVWMADQLGMPTLMATPGKRFEDLSPPPNQLTPSALHDIAAIVGETQLRTDNFERAFHARGQSYKDLLALRDGDLGSAPDAIVYPRSADEILRLMELAAQAGFSIVPFGGGSSVVGGVTPDKTDQRPVITLDLTEMDDLLQVDETSGTATAQAGIYGPQLEHALQVQGVTLGHYPQSFEFSTLGGWIAARGAGQQSNRYGKAEEWLVSARVATPSGLWSTESFPASAAGPNLNQMVSGSEGAFGVVVDATFRVRKTPDEQEFRGYMFPTFEAGAEAIRQINQADVPSAMLRLSDSDETFFFQSFGKIGEKESFSDALADRYLKFRGMGERPCLMIAGVEGAAPDVARSKHDIGNTVGAHGGISLGSGPGASWYGSRFASPYLRDPMMDHGLGVDTLETAASWSHIRALYVAVKEALSGAMRETAPRPGAHGLVMGHISHSYEDGASLYFTYVFPRALDDELGQWRKIKSAASDAINENGGTISHHHGVGADHAKWADREKGEIGMAILRAVKKEIDPGNLLNPGKWLG